ncbi:hypothetical protein AMTRI_Chr03g49770 [Amborella trichopoda]
MRPQPQTQTQEQYRPSSSYNQTTQNTPQIPSQMPEQTQTKVETHSENVPPNMLYEPFMPEIHASSVQKPMISRNQEERKNPHNRSCKRGMSKRIPQLEYWVSVKKNLTILLNIVLSHTLQIFLKYFQLN